MLFPVTRNLSHALLFYCPTLSTYRPLFRIFCSKVQGSRLSESERSKILTEWQISNCILGLKGKKIVPMDLDPSPKKAGAFRELGDAYREEGNIQKAIAYYKKELSIRQEIENPLPLTTERVLKFLGRGYQEEDLDKIVHVDIRDKGIAKTLNTLGFCYQIPGEEQTARRYFRRSIEATIESVKEGPSSLFPAPLEELYDLSMVFNALVDPIREAKRLKCYFPSLRQNPDIYIPKILHKIGNSLLKWGAYSEAILYFEEALAIQKQLWGQQESPLVVDIQKSLEKGRHALHRTSLQK